MRRLVPRSLAGQTILVLVIGLAVSHAVSMVIFASDRGEALSLVGGQNLAQRVANVTHLVAEAPADWRPRIVAAVNDPGFRVSLSAASDLAPAEDTGLRAALIRRTVENQLRAEAARLVLVEVLDVEAPESATAPGPGFGPGYMGRGMGAHMMEMVSGRVAPLALRISVELEQGLWINFATAIPESGSFWSPTSVISLSAMLVAIILLSIWVVRRLTRPLATFAEAAQRLGRDVNAPPIPDTGPSEVIRAVHAFNEMQDRLRRFVENRTRMVAAISHDLRTPITRLRLRAELVEDEAERAGMLDTLDEMERMIAATLAFARDDAEGETARTVDLTALLQSICDDLTDTGANVMLSAPDGVRYQCRPTAIRRAFANLIENAVKFGTAAEVRMAETKSAIEIEITDDGPGIAEEFLDQVFTPFFRVEASRNPETGGIGLGLSVAQTNIHSHGGEIEIANREQGGLRVRVRLPK